MVVFIDTIQSTLQAKIISTNEFETIFLVNVCFQFQPSIIIGLQIFYQPTPHRYIVYYKATMGKDYYDCKLGIFETLAEVKQIVDCYRLLANLELHENEHD